MVQRLKGANMTLARTSGEPSIPNEGAYTVIDFEFPDRLNIIAALQVGKPLILRGMDLSGIELSRLDFSGAVFERCILIGTDFTGSTLDSTHWRGCGGAESIFRSVSASDAQFQSSDLNNTKWSRSKLTHSSFKACKLTGADLSDCSTLGLTFNDTVLRNAILTGISFYKEHLDTLDFADADVAGCDFRQAVFGEGCSLANARIVEARFEQADLRGADLAGILMSDPRQFKNSLINPTQAAQLIKGLGLRVSI